jgi:GNAT superfamily N-acetyltransferase
VWVVNELRVDAEALGADELVAALDDLYGHLPHRRAVVERQAVGARLAGPMRERAWLVRRDVFMALGDGGDRRAEPGLAREVDEATLQAVEARAIAEEPFGEREVIEQLVASRSALGRAMPARFFVAAAPGEPDAGVATLYSDGTIAQVEDVRTLEAFRGRGLARAVCVAATEAALDAGHDLVFLVADDEDWPKDLYARLGFEAVGHPWSFTRPGPEHPAHRAG